MKRHNTLYFISTLLLILACMPATVFSTPTPVPPPTFTTTPAPTATFTPSPTFTPTLTFTPAPTNTPDPYWPYTIDYLRGRAYGGGAVELKQTLRKDGDFTRYLITYPSDGLTIYSVLNIPAGDGPFPVIIVLHGYERSGGYSLYKDSFEADDMLARQGYMVFHPALRNYYPSDYGDNLFRVGFAVDTLNLIALVKSLGGQAGALEKADPNRIGLYGFSMGGGVALRVLTVSSDVKAALLYSPVSGDESKNIPLFEGLAGGRDPQFDGEAEASAASLVHISPSYHYTVITPPVLIFHGTADSVVPVSWTQETCDLLVAAGRNAGCIFYDGASHIFDGSAMQDFVPRMFDFYNIYLRQ